MRSSRYGFTILELMVVVTLISLLTAIVVPHVLNARDRANQKTCINNLRQIDQAIQLWAADSKSLPTDIVTHTNLAPYLRKLPTCPAIRGGSFNSDYGMTFVEDPSYCVVNFSLASSPHSLNSTFAPVIAAGDTPQTPATENFPKPRKR
jgi:prepilin-type N-terminal cleavage/methylation domain-containing protein